MDMISRLEVCRDSERLIGWYVAGFWAHNPLRVRMLGCDCQQPVTLSN